ncbi:MAG: sigma-70 region 4 domain-containing protein [Planctomycetaceae bacterium]|nr:sigma-70 region 4 domain-containing protein [Planctomycetaceae bacterium]
MTDRPDFQRAFQLLSDRFLSVKGFISVCEAYKAYVEEGKSNTLTFFSFIVNRINLVLSEWQGVERVTPKVAVAFDGDGRTDSTSEMKHQEETGSTENVDRLLEMLPLQQRATLLLRIWPLEELSDAWRAKHLSTIVAAGAANDRSEDQVLSQLASVMERREPASEQKLFDAEVESNTYFQKERHWAATRRRYAMLAFESETSGEFGAKSRLKEELTALCYQAVSCSSAKQADHLVVADEQLYKTETGTWKFPAAIWNRRVFCRSCYKQKYYRNLWLKAEERILAMEPESGPMEHKDIASILGCPVGSCHANLSRGRETLRDSLGVAPSDRRKEIQAERDSENLNRVVCEDFLGPES